MTTSPRTFCRSTRETKHANGKHLSSRRRRSDPHRTQPGPSRAGYEVRSTGNAATLWRWITQGDGDLVITDVVMPDENAFDLIPRIRKARPDLPIVVMSAQNTFMTAIRASERGAYEYLPKPFDLKELISIVGRAMSEPKEPRTAPPEKRRP